MSADLRQSNLPESTTLSAAQTLMDAGVTGFWNFTGQELDLVGAITENVHLGDSLMTLCYRLCSAEVNDDEEGNDDE